MRDWAELNAASDSLLPTQHDAMDVLPALRDVLWSHYFTSEVQAVLKVTDAEVDSQTQVFGGHPVQVRLEPARIRCFAPDFLKIMTELLVNALRFSKPGRPVGVTGKPLGDAAYQLEIANLGVAMPEQFIAQIGALSQANRGQQEQQGMGLGLAISQLAARRNGASLQVPRIDGMPTVVRLVFALERKKEA